jgi:Fe-S-cluster containining protein
MQYGCKECSHCAACCKGWHIELSKEDIRSLAKLGYGLKEFLDVKPVPRMKVVGKEKSCIFLDKENMCVLEKKHGHGAKPHTCRHYPDINTEKIKEKDYFFFEYGGKIFARDVLVRMMDGLKTAEKHQLFERLLHELEKLGRHKIHYVDVFNYDEKKNPSALGKMLARRRVEDIIAVKFGREEREEFGRLEKNRQLNTKRMVEEMQKRLPGDDAINSNLPDMLLAYFRFLQQEEPRDAKKTAAYFFEWNAKRF